MAGAGLISLKRRIRSVTNTRKITKAMGLVATSKLRRSREVLEINKKYHDAFEETISYMTADARISLLEKNIYMNGNKGTKKLYIVLTSDSGLCGGFNANAVVAAVEAIKKDRAGSSVIVVGQKGRAYFKKMNIETLAEYVEIPDLPTLKEASIIGDKALGMFEAGEAGEVYVIYTKFYSAIKQTVDVKRLLPLEMNTETKSEMPSNIIYEPELADILKYMVKMNIRQEVLNFMLNSKASEQGSRMSSMDNATKNANDILLRLNLQYNRVRQTAITQEITEIVSGAEAQK
jgi:F-type H+-transporting ATPase subunit gamma